MMQADGSLKIKSYFAGSVELAIQEARRELGAEAVLVTSRRAAPEVSHKGAYEVVFGVSASAPEIRPQVEVQDLTHEVARLREQLENIKRALQPGAAAAPVESESEVGQVHKRLAAAGLDESLIRNIAGDVRATLTGARSSADPALCENAAVESIRKRLRFAPELASSGQDSKRSIVLVGPPGAGKTTTLAKIAMRECLGGRLSARIISVETHRVAAHEKLRSLAKIMGLGFTAANSMRELIEAVGEFRTKDILLVDTPGFGRDDFEAARDLIQFLAHMTPKEIHLVLPAPMNREDLMLCFRRYMEFQPDYLLFTKLDETQSRGAVVSLALESGQPVSFLSAGQNIPEDLQVATADALAGKFFGREAMAAVSAA